jgi:hypothetical protein
MEQKFLQNQSEQSIEQEPMPMEGFESVVFQLGRI